MPTLPKLIAFRLTSKCINDCPYCYGPDHNIKDLTLKQLKKLFAFLKDNKVDAILLTGGEPLLRNDFKEIIRELKRNNFKIFLDTCGYNFDKYKSVILKDIDVLGLPLDFHNKSYRRHDNVLKILKYFKNKKVRPVIRVGTVVTKDNFNNLKEIKDVLLGYSIDIWKIYQFLPLNHNAVKNKVSLNIPMNKFNVAIKSLDQVIGGGFRILVCKKKDRNKAYFFVNSDGSVFVPVYGKGHDDNGIDKILGNIYDDDILPKWNKVALNKNYVANAEVTFRYKFNRK
jgi:MoaA/NifB/PqqE/SkfB family radical SAM enzyme